MSIRDQDHQLYAHKYNILIPFQIAGIISVILTAVWTGYYLGGGGFAWQNNTILQFNWHPFLMMLGLIYLYGNGMRLK